MDFCGEMLRLSSCRKEQNSKLMIKDVFFFFLQYGTHDIVQSWKNTKGSNYLSRIFLERRSSILADQKRIHFCIAL